MAPTTVYRIDLVDSPRGAARGMPEVKGRKLGEPGPVHGTPYMGGSLVCNVHQIHFRLDAGDSVSLVPSRFIDRTSIRAGVVDRKVNTDDGPTTREVLRPARDTLVVADAPGSVLRPEDYPYEYHARFTLTVFSGATPIAKIVYTVDITALSVANVPNLSNRVAVVSKFDLVRNKSIP